MLLTWGTRDEYVDTSDFRCIVFICIDYNDHLPCLSNNDNDLYLQQRLHNIWVHDLVALPIQQ